MIYVNIKYYFLYLHNMDNTQITSEPTPNETWKKMKSASMQAVDAYNEYEKRKSNLVSQGFNEYVIDMYNRKYKKRAKYIVEALEDMMTLLVWDIIDRVSYGITD